jgi:hypothetical protein
MIADSFCADELRWRPIELSSSSDVDTLNALFAEGWRIEPIELEGLPFLAFCGREADSPFVAQSGSRRLASSPRLLLILQRSTGAPKQHAVLAERGSTGYIELEGRRSRAHRMVGIFPVGPDATLTIFQERS